MGIQELKKVFPQTRLQRSRRFATPDEDREKNPDTKSIPDSSKKKNGTDANGWENISFLQIRHLCNREERGFVESAGFLQ